MSENLDKSSYTFVWSIQNFSLCSQSFSECILSPTFLVEILDGSKFYLKLYPRGKTDDDVVHCDFHRGEDDGPEIVYFDVTLYIFEDNVLKYIRSEFCRAKQKQVLSVPLMEKRADLLDRNEVFLPNDTLTFQCSIFPNNSKDKSSKKCYANTIVHVERHSFVVPWISTSFVTSTTLNSSFQDCFFNVPILCESQYNKFEYQITFCLDLNKKGKVMIRRITTDDEESSDEKTPNKKIIDEKRLFVVFKAFLEDLSEKRKSIAFGEQILQSEEDEWNFPFSVDKSITGFVPKSEFFPVHLDFAISDGTYSTTSVKTVHDSLEILSEPNFHIEKGNATIWKAMLEDKKFCDVILRVENTDFGAHKCVLCASSPVFSAMLENDMKEKAAGVVEMGDITKVGLQQLLTFIYTGSVSDLQQMNAVELYVAADKYQILELKRVCSSFLKTKLALENVCDVLDLANLYQDQDLERKTRNYITSLAKDVLASTEWKSFMEKRLQLAADIMFDLCKKIWN